jgi:hypothetical protein
MFNLSECPACRALLPDRQSIFNLDPLPNLQAHQVAIFLRTISKFATVSIDTLGTIQFYLLQSVESFVGMASN